MCTCSCLYAKRLAARTAAAFRVILAWFTRGDSHRAVSHGTTRSAGVSSLGKHAGFTLLFACDGPTRLTWRVFDTRSRAFSLARSRRDPVSDAARLPVGRRRREDVSCRDTDAGDAASQPPTQRHRHGETRRDIHKWLRRVVRAVVWVRACVWWVSERRTCVRARRRRDDDDDVWRRHAAPRRRPRRDGLERIGRLFGGAGPHLREILTAREPGLDFSCLFFYGRCVGLAENSRTFRKTSAKRAHECSRNEQLGAVCVI